MTPIKRALTLSAMVLATAIAALGQWQTGISLLLTFEFVLAARRAVCGVNSLGTLATATIVQEALSLVFTKRPILNNISMGFTDRNGSPIAQYGQAVITRTLSLPTVQNAGSSASAATTTDVSVTLSNFKEVRYDFTAVEYSSTNRDLIRECAEPMATAIANYIVDQVSAIWTVANFPTRTGADAVANGSTVSRTFLANGWDYDHLLDVRKTLNKSGVAEDGRFYVANSDVYGALLSDLRIVGYLNNQQNAGAITSGKLPQVAGFSLAEYPACPTTANLVGFAGTKDSVVYAHRVPRHPSEVIAGLPIPGNVGIVTEPRTGLSVMAVEYVDLSTLAVTTKLLWMNGVAVGNPNNGQLIETSA